MDTTPDLTKSSRTDPTLTSAKILHEAPEFRMTYWEGRTASGEHHILTNFMEDFTNGWLGNRLNSVDSTEFTLS